MKILRKIANFFVLIYTFILDHKNYYLVNAVLDIAKVAANHTKTGIDNVALANLATFIRYKTEPMGDTMRQEVSKMVTEKKRGPLKEFSLNLDHQAIKLTSPIGEVKYNHKDKSLEFGTNLAW